MVKKSNTGCQKAETVDVESSGQSKRRKGCNIKAFICLVSIFLFGGMWALLTIFYFLLSIKINSNANSSGNFLVDNLLPVSNSALNNTSSAVINS